MFCYKMYKLLIPTLKCAIGIDVIKIIIQTFISKGVHVNKIFPDIYLSVPDEVDASFKIFYKMFWDLPIIINDVCLAQQ